MFLFISTAICASFDYCYSQDTSQCPSSSQVFDSYQSLVSEIKQKQTEATSFSITIIPSSTDDITFDFSIAPNATSFTFQSKQPSKEIKFINTRSFILILRDINSVFEGSQSYTFETLDIDLKSEVQFPKESSIKCKTLTCPLSLLETFTSYDASIQLTILVKDSPSTSFTTSKSIYYVKIVTYVNIVAKTIDSATTVTFPNQKQIIIPFISTNYKSPSVTKIEIHADSTYDVDLCNLVMEVPEINLEIYNSKVTITQHRSDLITRLNIDLYDGGHVVSKKDLDVYKFVGYGKDTSITAPLIQVPGSWKMFNNSEVIANLKDNYIDEIYLNGNCKIISDFPLYTKIVQCHNNEKGTEQTIAADVYILNYTSYGLSKVTFSGIHLEKGAVLQCVCINGEVTPLKVTRATVLNISFCTDPNLDTQHKESLFDQLYLDKKNTFDIIETTSDIKINLIPNTFLGKELGFFQITAFLQIKRVDSLYKLRYLDTPMSYILRYCYGGDINKTRCSLLPRFYSSEYNEDWKKQVKLYTSQIYLYLGDDTEYIIDASDINSQAEMIFSLAEQSKLKLSSKNETSIIGFGFYGGSSKVDLNNFNKLTFKLVIDKATVEFQNSEKLSKIYAIQSEGSVVSFDQKVTFSGKSYVFKNSTISGDLSFAKSQNLIVDTTTLNIFDPNAQYPQINLNNDVEKIDLQHGQLEFTFSNKEKVTVKAIHTRTISVICLSVKNLTISCSGTDERQIPRLDFNTIWDYNVVGKWPQTELPLVFAETRILAEFLDKINVNVKTEGAFPLGLAHLFSGRNVYIDSEKDVEISYNLKPIEDNFYPYFYSSKNIHLKKIQLTNNGGIGYVTNTSNKLSIDEVEASGQSIELNNVEVTNMTMIKSSITGIFTNLVDSYVTMNVPVNNQWLSTFNTNGKCELNLFKINDDRHLLIANRTENIFCCSGGLSVKKLKSDTGNLYIKDNCIVFRPSTSSSKVRMILMITIPICVFVIIVFVALFVFIRKRSGRNKFETSTELTAALL